MEVGQERDQEAPFFGVIRVLIRRDRNERPMGPKARSVAVLSKKRKDKYETDRHWKFENDAKWPGKTFSKKGSRRSIQSGAE